MKKFSIKELSRLETEIDEEIDFAKSRHRSALQKTLPSQQAAEDAAMKAAKEVFSRTQSLLTAKYAIRSIKQTFNAEKGINDKTRAIAQLHAEQELLDSIAQQKEVTAIDRYGSNKLDYRPGITTEVQDEYRAKSRVVQRQIQRLKDSCQGINNQGTIELEEDVYHTLVSVGLIDA